MPYITPENRRELDATINVLVNKIRKLADNEDMTTRDGDLNYVITRLIVGVLELSGKPKYHKFCSATGICENVKQEIYRRLATPYENEKKVLNGDVYH